VGIVGRQIDAHRPMQRLGEVAHARRSIETNGTFHKGKSKNRRLGTLPFPAYARNTRAVFVHFEAFLAIATLLALTPGPDTALVTRNALVGGRRAGVFTIFGIGSGLVVWTLAASVGIAAVLRTSEPAFLAVKIVGSAYLIFLGAQALWGAVRGVGGRVRLAPPGTKRIPSRLAFRQGAVCNLGNPKIPIFFTSFLPQFAKGNHPSFTALLLLALAFSAIGLLWLSLYNVVLAKAGEFLRRPTVRRVVEGVTGTALVAFGISLAVEHR
jgi:threonine/homoserine/homoserine lactone efflux protein